MRDENPKPKLPDRNYTIQINRIAYQVSVWIKRDLNPYIVVTAVYPRNRITLSLSKDVRTVAKIWNRLMKEWTQETTDKKEAHFEYQSKLYRFKHLDESYNRKRINLGKVIDLYMGKGAKE